MEIHLRDTEDGVDFIICYSDSEQHSIYEIKNGKCAEVDVAWIGSYNAFKYFQETNLGDIRTIANSNTPHGIELAFGASAQSSADNEYQKLFNAFQKTISDCGDSAVGGFAIPIYFDIYANKLYIRDMQKAMRN